MIGTKVFEESSLRIGYILCLVTAVGFICSLTYNVGYFWWFEGGFRLLSIGDILTSYSLWIPGLGTLFFCYSLDLFLQHVEQTKKSVRAKKRQDFIRAILGVPHLIVVLVMFAILLSYVLYGFFFRPIIIWLSVCYLLLSLAGYLATTKLFSGRFNQYILGIFAFIPTVLFLLFALGMDKARADANLQTANAHLYFINEDKPQPTILLRHLEKGLLAKQLNSSNYVLFTWDDLSRVEIIARDDHFAGLLNR